MRTIATWVEKIEDRLGTIAHSLDRLALLAELSVADRLLGRFGTETPVGRAAMARIEALVLELDIRE